MKKSELTAEFIMDWWLSKYHNTSCKEIVRKHPRLCKTSRWYNLYPVTQEQHDEWYKWAIDILSKTLKVSKTYTKRAFVFDYLNCAPNVITDKK